MDPFGIDVMMEWMAHDPPLSDREIWGILAPEWHTTMSEADVAARVEDIKKAKTSWDNYQAKKPTHGHTVLLTAGEHATKMGWATGMVYSSPIPAPTFHKTATTMSHAVKDVILQDTGEMLAGVRLEDLLYEKEFEKPCCFGTDCEGSGMYTRGYIAEPRGGWVGAAPHSDPYGECCRPCYDAKIVPHHAPSSPPSA